MKNKTALIVGGIVIFIILLAIIGGSGSNNNSQIQTPPVTNNQIPTTSETINSQPVTPSVSTSLEPTKTTPKKISPAPVTENYVPPQQTTPPADPALSVSCSVSQTSLNTGQTAVWTAQPSGGNGVYNYSWSGSDGLSGNSQSISKSYSTVGVKSASVNVISGSQSVNKSCGNTLTISIPTPPTPSPISLSGTGQQATQKFSLESGLSIFTLSHSGSRNFAIWLMDSNGNNVDLLVNTVGQFNGSKAVGIDSAGPYLLNITADGVWSVNITQPRVSTAPVTTNFSNSGQQASQLFYLSKGLHVFQLTHDGSRNFAIWLMDKNGNNVDLLVNTIGTFNGSKAVGIDSDGIYLLNITADGNWTVSIQ